MDNLKYYNDSLAYDFEMFAPRTAAKPKKADNIVVMPKVANRNKKRSAAATKALNRPVMAIMCAVLY